MTSFKILSLNNGGYIMYNLLLENLILGSYTKSLLCTLPDKSECIYVHTVRFVANNDILLYRIAPLCGGGKYWRIWRIHCHSPIIYPPILTCHLVSKLVIPNLPNISPPILRDKPIHQYFPLPHNCAIRYSS